ncbi:MAG: hypothetical protein ABSG53_16875 [Thermoguttaceae bacterium]
MASRYESGGTSTSSTLLISDGKQWLDEGRRGNWADGKIESRNLCDRELVRHISPDGDIKALGIQNLSEFVAKEHAPGNIPEMPPARFPPFLLVYSEHYIPPHSFPDIGKILADPATKVLPWRTRVGGHVCYVVERTRTTQTPIFRSREAIEAWQKQNPKGSVIVNRDAAAKDMRIDEYTDRVALDPQSGFLAAHWASGHKSLIPGFRVKSTGRDVPRRDVTQFPVEEAVCTDFRKFGDLGYVAGRVELPSSRRYATKGNFLHQGNKTRPRQRHQYFPHQPVFAQANPILCQERASDA